MWTLYVIRDQMCYTNPQVFRAEHPDQTDDRVQEIKTAIDHYASSQGAHPLTKQEYLQLIWFLYYVPQNAIIPNGAVPTQDEPEIRMKALADMTNKLYAKGPVFHARKQCELLFKQNGEPKTLMDAASIYWPHRIGITPGIPLKLTDWVCRELGDHMRLPYGQGKDPAVAQKEFNRAYDRCTDQPLSWEDVSMALWFQKKLQSDPFLGFKMLDKMRGHTLKENLDMIAGLHLPHGKIQHARDMDDEIQSFREREHDPTKRRRYFITPDRTNVLITLCHVVSTDAPSYNY